MLKNDLFVYLTLPFVVCFLLLVWLANYAIGWTLHQVIRLNEILIRFCETIWQRYVCYLKECV